MNDNHWSFTSKGTPKGEEILWIRDSWNLSFSSKEPNSPTGSYLTFAVPPKNSGTETFNELFEYFSSRKRKVNMVAEGFSARFAWELALKKKESIQSLFLLFPNPSPVSGFALPILEKADWILKNLSLLPRFITNPFSLDKILSQFDQNDIYESQISVSLGVLLPRTVGQLSAQAEQLSRLSKRTQIYRWETRNPRFSEPEMLKLDKILELFWNSSGQKRSKSRIKTKF
ncbi:hypothetical protein LEP1GSC047_3798 [Leptospira inadai serovar Lyme str. 10]|uniref:Alpha/beta hydrolase n=1 Tax=Leptospira inadai serovar Lyme str. 10 TaxID=1049790 RepID=V6HXL0_9LEPT|nr:hypothetical protein [Leptospira inadai]EQA37744.1 hypothetical protein LEP1GSC047_3798 [Leptospira inadai serovar Lyme str. 10]